MYKKKKKKKVMDVCMLVMYFMSYRFEYVYN